MNDAYAIMNLTPKQFGDACEELVSMEVKLAGIPTFAGPAGWPKFDLVATEPTGMKRISVKGLRAGNGQRAGWWQFTPDGWDYLALVRVGIENKNREVFILPHKKALQLSRATRTGERRINYRNPGLQAYLNNFTLKLEADPSVATSFASDSGTAPRQLVALP